MTAAVAAREVITCLTLSTSAPVLQERPHSGRYAVAASCATLAPTLPGCYSQPDYLRWRCDDDGLAHRQVRADDAQLVRRGRHSGARRRLRAVRPPPPRGSTLRDRRRPR